MDDDLPPKPHTEEEGAAGALGELMGAGMWILLFLLFAGGVLYVVTRAHG